VCLASSAGLAQTWTRLTNNAPAGINLMLLLSDGTVMAANNNGSTIGRAWYKLTPNATGSYVNGTWTTLASMIDTRLYYSAQVLKDGRVFVAGGEYGTGASKAEVYDPVANTWTAVNPPTSVLNPGATSPVTGGSQAFVDSNSEILDNGNVLIAPVSPRVSGQPVIYNPTTNTWAAGPNYVRGGYQDEASWVKLPDQTILTIDPFGTNSERYNPATNTWINDGVVPVSLYDPFGSELGASFLLPNGKAFYLGSTGHTALYTPSGSASPGAWQAGPDIPGAHGTPDAPAAMMVTGHILCAVSPVPTSGNHFPTPTTFYEYDPVANAFTSVAAPVGASDPISSYQSAMLVLPDGGILYSHMANTVYEYRPSGAPLALGKPVILNIMQNGDGSYHLVGTGLNGISEGAAYGDDLQMNSNYPIVRINHSNGNTYYARSYNWSGTSVMTGATVLSTEYRLPAGLPTGQYTVSVVANGNASDPYTGDPCPVFTQNPAPATLCAGGSFQLTVAALGTPPPTFQWRKDTVPIPGAVGTTYQVSGATPADSGVYDVVATNDCGSVNSGTAAVVVNSPPQISQQPASMTAALGTPASFSVVASGVTTYTWRHNSQFVPNGNTPTLVIASVQSGDDGDYDCIVNGPCGQRISQVATLTIGSACYANCDGSTTQPILTVNDFICFQARFASGDSYANCDGSSSQPMLTVNDFICFQSAFATGCP
jgi:hypothetical protein